MRIVICDDVVEVAEDVKQDVEALVSEAGHEVLTRTPDALLLEMEEDLFDYDIAILDIEYHEEKNGIDFGHILNQKFPLTQIIYLTEVLDFASDVYETEHVYFCMKKNRKQTLPRAIDKAILFYEENKDRNYLEIVSEGKKHVILQVHILYMERQGHTILIHTADETYKVYDSFRNIVKNLASSFARCHGGFVVNMSQIVSINRERVLLAGGAEIEIGRTYKNHFLMSYMDYMGKRM